VDVLFDENEENNQLAMASKDLSINEENQNYNSIFIDETDSE
jgi:hypothetical protein